MTTFDDREMAFESKFQHDQELLFRIRARRAKLVGQWAADQLGLTGADAEAYVRQIVDRDFAEPTHRQVVDHIEADFRAKGLDISRHRIEREMERLLEVAKDQIMNA